MVPYICTWRVRQNILTAILGRLHGDAILSALPVNLRHAFLLARPLSSHLLGHAAGAPTRLQGTEFLPSFCRSGGRRGSRRGWDEKKKYSGMRALQEGREGVETESC